MLYRQLVETSINRFICSALLQEVMDMGDEITYFNKGKRFSTDVAISENVDSPDVDVNSYTEGEFAESIKPLCPFSWNDIAAEVFTVAKSNPEEQRSDSNRDLLVRILKKLEETGDKTVRELYLNLLRSDMTTYKKPYVHPSFVDIISQLSADETRFIHQLKATAYEPYAILDVVLLDKNNNAEFATGITNFTNDFDLSLSSREKIQLVVFNLARIGLIKINEGQAIADSKYYDTIEASPLVSAKLRTPTPSNMLYKTKRKTFVLTEYGANFKLVCEK
jgi:hypothetical protein